MCPVVTRGELRRNRSERAAANIGGALSEKIYGALSGRSDVR